MPKGRAVLTATHRYGFDAKKGPGGGAGGGGSEPGGGTRSTACAMVPL